MSSSTPIRSLTSAVKAATKQSPSACTPGTVKAGARKPGVPTPQQKTPSTPAVGITKPVPIRQGARRPVSANPKGFTSTFAPIATPARSVLQPGRSVIQPVPLDLQLRKLIVEKQHRRMPAVFEPRDNWDEGYFNKYYHDKQCDALNAMFAGSIVINILNGIQITALTRGTPDDEKQKIITLRDLHYEAVATAVWNFRCAYGLLDSAIAARYCSSDRFYEGVIDPPHWNTICMLRAEMNNVGRHIDNLNGFQNVLRNPYAATPRLTIFVFVDSRLATDTAGVVVPEKCANAIRPAPNTYTTATAQRPRVGS